MRLPIIVTTLVLAANLALGQDKPPDNPFGFPKPEAFEAVIIPVKTLSGDSFNRLARMLSVFKAQYTSDEKLRTIVVYAPKEVVAQMKRVVEELDRPGSEAAIGRNIDLTLSFLRCSIKASTEPHSLPADLEPVARQLRAATQYKDVQLWDVVPLHVQEGTNVDQSLRLPSLTSSAPGFFATGHVRVRAESVSRKDSGRSVRFDMMNIGFKIPYALGTGNSNVQFFDVGVNTSGDFMEGQKTVLGKVSGIDDESAIFVVVSLKVLD